MDTKNLIEWDREFVWHPFTPMKPWCENKDIVVIERGEAEFLVDTEGKRYIDAVSSMWCNVHGHCVPELDAAVMGQLGKIAHSSLLGLGNVPSIRLAKHLVELVHRSGMGLEKVFYSDNGSTAVEVACKMAYQYWRNTESDSINGTTESAADLSRLRALIMATRSARYQWGGYRHFIGRFRGCVFRSILFHRLPTQPRQLRQCDKWKPC